MKRSSAVPLVLVTALAAAMSACREKRPRYCVDENNFVVRDEECRDNRHPTGSFSHHWYYGGTRGYVAPGTQLSGVPQLFRLGASRRRTNQERHAA